MSATPRRSRPPPLARRLRNARGPTLLALWAFAPPVVVQEGEDGGLTFSVGAGAGQYEVVRRGCAGELLSSERIPFRTVGAQVDYERSSLRVSAYGGSRAADSADHDGGYLGGQVAFEGGSVGVGLGATRVPGDETTPNLYLRFGRRDKVFVVGDHLAPGPVPGVTGVSRVGVGFGVGGTRGLAGFSAGRALSLSGRTVSLFESNGDNMGLFAEFDVPMSAKLDLHLGGSWFASEEFADWAIGAGLRVHPRD